MAVKSVEFRAQIRSWKERLGKDPRLTARVVLGLLLVANLTAAAAVFKPWAGSEEELQRQRAQLRLDLQQRRATADRLRNVVQTVEKTRAQGDQFFDEYFLDRQTAYSTVLGELNSLADKAGMKRGDDVYTYDPVEGSSTLSMMTISANYLGTYADLIEFVNAIDRSPRFLTIERLQAQPMQTPGTLAIYLRLNVFVRGEVGAE